MGSIRAAFLVIASLVAGTARGEPPKRTTRMLRAEDWQPPKCTKRTLAEEWHSRDFSHEWAMCRMFGVSEAPDTPDEHVAVTLASGYYADTGPKYVLVVAHQAKTEGEIDTCHACAAPSDVHVYARQRGAWRQIAELKDVPGGSHGNPSSASFISLGPKRRGIAFEGGGTFQGIVTGVVSIYALPTGDGDDTEIRAVAPEIRTEIGNCANIPSECDDVESTYQLKPGSNRAWYDLVVHEKLTHGRELKLPEGADESEALQHRKLRTRERSIRYVFDGSTYIEAKRPR